MEVLRKSTILYVNQVRQENFEKLIGKGTSEALSWREYFKQVIFVCYSSTNHYLYRKLYQNCYLIGIPFNLSSSIIKSIFKIGQNYVNLYLFLIQLTKKTQIDIIRIENLLLSGLPVYLVSKKRNIPYIMWLGGFERKSLLIKYQKNIFTWILSKLVILFEKIILKNANFVFPVTEELMELAEKRNVSNKYLSPNFVDLTKFKDLKIKDKSHISEKLKILYVGRFEEEKGIKVLLNAIKLISKENDNIEFSLVGDGSLKTWIKNFIKVNKLRNVKLPGLYSHEEMPQIYNKADIFILPSYTEGSPASLIEAMSCGIPSIATAVGLSNIFIKNGENGILIPPGDPVKISEAIKTLADNKNLMEKCSQKGRDTILTYTKNYSKIHKNIYKKILSEL
ncbi:MAG: glycosyltransferase family 4 protein [Promethearchaeota archaeon]